MKRYFVRNSCTESWDGMSGDERKRFCESCQRAVYNFSELTRREVERLSASSKSHSICGRISYVSEGVPLFRPEPASAVGQLVRISLLGLAGLTSLTAADEKTCSLQVGATDVTGEKLTKASVTVLMDGKRVADGTLNAEGNFVTQLPVGHYSIRVEALGFQPFVKENVNLACSAQESLEVVADMRVGLIGEVVVVESDGNLFHRLKRTIERGIARIKSV